jgi:hypothetical protein
VQINSALTRSPKEAYYFPSLYGENCVAALRREWILTLLLLAGVSAVEAAYRPVCKVRIGDEFRLVERIHVLAECRVAARRRVAALVCTPGVRKFEYRFLFEDKVYKAIASCGRGR